MPNIRQYTSDVDGLQPTNMGAEAFVQAGRRIGQFYNQAAGALEDVGKDIGSGVKTAGDAAVDYMEHQEINHGSLAQAGLFADLTAKWNQTAKNADPNDPTVASKFEKGQLEPALEDFRDSFLTEGGQKWADSRVDALRNHFFEKTTADMSSMAGAAAVINQQRITNTYANVVRQDPSALPMILQQHDDGLGALVKSSPNLTPEQAARVQTELSEKGKQQIVWSAVQGVIEKNPDEGLKMASDPRYAPYINAAEADRFAKEVTRANKLDYDMTRTRQRQALEDRSTSNLNNVIRNLYDPNQTQKVTAAQIAQLPDDQMRPSDREHAIKLIDAELKPQAESKRSAIVADSMLTGIRSGNVTMDDIYKAKEDGKITRADFSFLQTQYTTYRDESGDSLPRKREAFINNFKHVIDSSNEFTGTTDEIGKRHLWEFEQELVRKEDLLRKQGQDPHQLYDNKSQFYMGSPQALAPYKKTAEEEQAAALSSIRGGATAAQPAWPDVGTKKNGFTYTGGDPGNKANWSKD